MATRHMAASAHHLAAEVALQVLEAGGNAIDAGVAGGLTLNVVHSDFTHFAGVAPIVIRSAATGEVVTISGLGCWPRATDPEVFHREHDGEIPTGLLRTVVPGAPDAWLTALERYGTMTFREVVGPAIAYARDGYPVNSLASEVIGELADHYRRWPENTAVFLPEGRPPQPGERMRLPDLAATLQFLADTDAAAAGGRIAGIAAVREAFYQGDIARSIVAYHEANGGWLRREDLAEFRVGIEAPVVTRFGDVDVYACGPWCQGPVLPQTLAILSGIDLAALGHNSPQYIHMIVEALKLAFADRHHYYGDPRFVDVPIDMLISDAYAATRRALIATDHAAATMPAPGLVPDAAGAWTEPPLDTSYICVADSHGNLFSATPSDGCFDGPMIPGTGLCPSPRGAQSWTDPAHPACLAPGKRPRLTCSPGIAIRKNHWAMPFGSPGDDVQPQAMLQFLLNMVLFDMAPQPAVDAPRFATFSFPRSSAPHEYYPGRLSLERRFGDDIAATLTTLGHKPNWWGPWEWRAGGLCAVRRDDFSGLLVGAADRRRPGGVSGL